MSEERKNDEAISDLENDNYYGEQEDSQKKAKEIEVSKPEVKVESQKQESNDVKEHKVESSNVEQEESKNDDIDIDSLKDSLLKTKKWGQEKNKKLITQKRKISDFVSSLKQEGVVDEDNIQQFLSNLDTDDIDEQIDEAESNNPYTGLKEKLDSEFKIFKKYNKGSELEAKYKAFYDFFPILDEKQQVEAMEYIAAEESDIALDYVMTQGEDLYKSLYKGAKDKGGILKYVQHLQKKLNDLEKSKSELSKELDHTTKSVYNKTDSSAKENNSNSFFDNDYYS